MSSRNTCSIKAFLRIDRLFYNKQTNEKAVLQGIRDACEQRKLERGSKPKLAAEATETEVKSNNVTS